MATNISSKGIIEKPVDRWILNPMKRFISKSSTGGIILFSSALLAMVIANSPYADAFHHFWEMEFSVGFNGKTLSKSLHHWINDGLMAVFFFVVGLELKREIMAGELSTLSKAALPMAGAIGGMLLPALVYLMFNPDGEASSGWGVPMATDIAFVLGILYLLGDRVPITLKVFLTALAIADDIGAVLVIALFYTSDIDVNSLWQAAFYLGILLVANQMGVRSTLFYALIGIGGVWLAFLFSGVHATIAAVLAAFMIPASVKVREEYFSQRMEELMRSYREEEPNGNRFVTNNQLHIIDEMRDLSKKALTPLQRLEHGMHPLVSFVIMPVFALANAGVRLEEGVLSQLSSPVTVGVAAGLLLGKFLGIMLAVTVFLKLGWARLPEGTNWMHLAGAAVLAGIGFTMSLFISELAFTDELLIKQAKLGILAASLIASLVGYAIIHRACRKAPAS